MRTLVDLGRVALVAALFSLGATGCGTLFYQPSRELYSEPHELGLRPRDLEFRSRDGTRLHGWLFAPIEPAKKDAGPVAPVRGTVLQFHGNAENQSSHYLSLAWLTVQGYELLTFDYRGYGRSEGEPDQAGLYQDAIAALDQAWKAHEASGSGRFIVVGQSLGGVVVLRALQDWDPDGKRVDLLVLDSTFHSYRQVASRILRRQWYTWLLSPLPYLLVSDEFAPSERLGELRIPALVMHDHRDPVVAYDCGKELFDRLPGPSKQFWELDRGFHVGAFYEAAPGDEGQANRQRFRTILDALPPRSASAQK